MIIVAAGQTPAANFCPPVAGKSSAVASVELGAEPAAPGETSFAAVRCRECNKPKFVKLN